MAFLNKRNGTIKLPEQNIGKTFCDINCTNIFLSLSPKAIEIKVKINKWNPIKVKSFCTLKETINKMKKHKDWDKYLQTMRQTRANFQNIKTAHTIK